MIATLNLFNLAQKFKNLQSFIHVSNSFVNSDKKGWIEEKIYNDFGADP